MDWGSGMGYPESGKNLSRIQGSKKAPDLGSDPQHCGKIQENFNFGTWKIVFHGCEEQSWVID